MPGLLLQFAENIGLATLLILGLGAITDRIAPRWPYLVQPTSGVLFGLLAVLFMSLSFEIQSGVIVDLRSLIVFLAGPFGGPLAAAIAGALAAAYRFYLGGAGAFAGVAGIMSTAALGCIVGWRYRHLFSWKMAALWGGLVSLVSLPWALTIGDLAFGWSVLQRIAVPTTIFYIGGTVLLSLLHSAMQRRREAERALAANEARFRDIAEMASDWFWEMDENLRVTYASPRAEKLTGFSTDYYKGKQRRELAINASPAAFAAHEKLLRERKPFRDFRYSVRTSDGGMLDIVTNGNPVFDENGDFIGYRGCGRDVSAENRSRQQIEEARMNAELANKAKSEFLAAMSHELRTPLNAILGFSEIMRKEMFGKHNVPAYQGYAADINSSAEYLLSLVNDVLDVARVESGRIELHKEPCDLAQTVTGALRLLEGRAQQGGISLTKEIQPEMPAALLDERAIKQIVVNLVTNAVKFTKAPGEVSIQVGFAADEGYRITVTDSGVGIAASEISAVLQPFQKSSGSQLVTQEGTGLGLPLSKALVEAHGGRLELESELGQGTTVRITLPAESADSPTERGEQPDRPLAC